jgi:hypothetical protein
VALKKGSAVTSGKWPTLYPIIKKKEEEKKKIKERKRKGEKVLQIISWLVTQIIKKGGESYPSFFKVHVKKYKSNKYSILGISKINCHVHGKKR